MSDAAEVQDIGSELPASSGNRVEEIAQKMGWNPDFEGENAIGAEEFILNANEVARTASKAANDRADRIAKLERQIEQQGKNTERLMREFQEQATARLKREMKEAVDAGDHARAAEIMDETRQAAKGAEPAPEPAANGVPNDHAQLVGDWLQRASWYNTDPVVQSVADALFNATYRPDMSSGEVNELLGTLEGQVKKELPHKFARTPVTDVNDDNRPAGKTKSSAKLWSKLNDAERETANELIEGGFAADLKSVEAKRERYAKMMLGED